MPRDRRYYCTYIMGSLTGTLYIGVSGNHRRVFQHKFHHFAGFTDRYEVVRLLYWESYDDVHRALAREKQLKGWNRTKKIALFARRNPHWIDLARDWYSWMKEPSEGRDASTTNDRRVRSARPPLSMTTSKQNCHAERSRSIPARTKAQNAFNPKRYNEISLASKPRSVSSQKPGGQSWLTNYQHSPMHMKR